MANNGCSWGVNLAKMPRIILTPSMSFIKKNKNKNKAYL